MKDVIVTATIWAIGLLPLLAQEPNDAHTFEDLATALASTQAVKILTIKQGDPDIDRINELVQLTQLEKLVLHHCGLSEFPNLSSLRKLTYLDLSYNRFDHVPETVTKLQTLESFAMFENKLTSLPTSIQNMENLQFLFLGKNPDLDIADAIVKLEPLAKLKNLGFGGITMPALPEDVGKLQSLTLLWIAGTGLDTLPDSLSKLQKLEVLVLTECNFKKLPKVVENLPNLKALQLEGNPMSENEFLRIESVLPNVHIKR